MINAGSLLVLASLLSRSVLPGGDTIIPIDPGLRGGGGSQYAEPPPISETGSMSFADWQLKFGGSYLDYEEWLKGV